MGLPFLPEDLGPYTLFMVIKESVFSASPSCYTIFGRRIIDVVSGEFYSLAWAGRDIIRRPLVRASWHISYFDDRIDEVVIEGWFARVTPSKIFPFLHARLTLNRTS